MTLEIQRPGETRGTYTVGANVPSGSGGITISKPTHTNAPTNAPTPAAPQHQHQHQQELSLDDIGDLANPNKYVAPPADDTNASPAGEQQPDDFGNDEDDSPIGYADYGGQEQPEPEPEMLPTPPFKTLDEERAHLMFQLHKMRETGVPVRTFTYRSDIQELRAEFARLKAELDTKAAVRFSKTALMSVVSGMELLSRKQNVLEVNLDGWSEAVHSDVDKGNFDAVLEALYLKYRGKMSLPPELQLVFMLVSSAVAWHVMHSRIKTFAPPPPPPAPSVVSDPPPDGRRVMRAPGFGGGGGLGGLASGLMGGGLAGNLPVNTRPPPPPQRGPSTSQPAKRKSPSPPGSDFGSPSPAMSVLSEMSDLDSHGDDDFAKDNTLRDIRVVSGPPAKKPRAPRSNKKTVVML